MKRVISTLILAFTAGMVFAQTDTGAVKKMIRDIKMSEEYVYGEENNADMAVAKQAALDELSAAVREMLITEENKTKAEAAEIWRNAENSVLQLSYQMGPYCKVLAYVPKKSLGIKSAGEPTEGVTEINVATEVTKTDVPTEVTKADVPTEVAKADVPTEVTKTDVPTEVTKTDIPTEVTKTDVPTEATKTDVPTEVAKTDIPTEEIEVNNGLSPEKRAEIEAQLSGMPLAIKTGVSKREMAVDNKAKMRILNNLGKAKIAVEVNPLNNATPKVKRTLEDLLAMDTYESIMLYLDTMKDQGRLVFGSLKRLIQPERAYFIVVKDGKLETILNKGGMERVNLKTNQVESVEKYLGYGIIWMQIF